MLILEIAGTYRPEQVRALLQPTEQLEHFAYGVLGDFSLRIHTPKNDDRLDAILRGLNLLGLEVIGYRWKREYHAEPVRHVSINVEPVHAPEPWYVRLFSGGKRTATH
ncbi:hypothetical protein [Deinococcus misasensis]|uniref:hypothetical protein n=1 Tax=Deinococcus misasensis TaxID=392413 RepID=UPI00054D662D|nr:hypothetical protein [Deinococcus misasensis]